MPDHAEKLSWLNLKTLGIARDGVPAAWFGDSGGAGGRPDRTSRFRLPVEKTCTQLFSPSSATYSPPFLKCFLRLGVSPEAVRLRCFAATGNRPQELDPPVEGEITIPLR